VTSTKGGMASNKKKLSLKVYKYILILTILAEN